ncbi:hypothetical protein ACIPIN_02175 [Pseudomonas sp. NPDC087697]|uniref:hypothetical protein n=1 Tax=Pseudomonas sp. NPDC087697 TaxID=3364447 RepID=UPI0037F65A9A
MIEPKEVTRDNCGNWTHPDLPVWGEGESGETINAWFAAQGMERKPIMLEGDLSADDYDKWAAKGDYDAEGWEPTKPDGEGWFILSIHDTDDGPVCWWARKVTT